MNNTQNIMNTEEATQIAEGSVVQPIITTVSLAKYFKIGEEVCQALRGVSIKIYQNDFTIIYGASGSGKSTLLNCLIGLEPPSEGEIWISGQRIDTLREDDRSQFRSTNYGIVHQQPIWIKALTIVENVELPLLINGVDFKTARNKAIRLINDVGMGRYLKHKPTEISGGQQQKVSLARALINDPEILFLDEPTGNLDTHASDEVMALLKKLNNENKKTIVLITHNLQYLPYANRTILIKDGQVDRESVSQEETNIVKKELA